MASGNISITKLNNIGESRRRAFEKVGVATLFDLIKYYPRAYQNRGYTMTVSEIKSELSSGTREIFSAVLTVAAEPQIRMIRRGMTLVKLRLFDENGACEATFFNQTFLKDVFHTGMTFRFWGKFVLSGGRLTVSSPIYEPVIEGRELPEIVPVYPLTSGLSQKIVASAVSGALKILLPETEEILSGKILEKYSLPTLPYAVKNIHFPDSEEALNAAKRRLMFDELIITSLALGISSKHAKCTTKFVSNNIDTSQFRKLLPYKLTGAQERASREILSDMSSGYAMNRMLTGDVGSGKTVVAAETAYVSLKNGYDCMLMAPTEILAAQHYGDLAPKMNTLGFETYLLTGSTRAAVRRNIITALASSTPVLVIGTHALISDDVISEKLGLIIIDEQHRFGAMQRAALADKAPDINTLVMSATPIPRTLSLIMSGGLDVSQIDELPKGRQTIDTFVVNESYRERLNRFIAKNAADGHQIYIVCPSIEESHEKKQARTENPEEMADILLTDEPADEKIPLKAATAYTAELRRALPDLRIEFVHGKMKSSDRDQIMKSFCGGEIDVLVSTTVIEVGVNVPNATLMIIENAERFGLSALHQLRGRVGRGSFKSYMILVSDAKSDRAKERLNIIKHNSNGYSIAEEDLKLRGPGDLFAENGFMRQHGESALALASKCTDTELIAAATEAAAEILSSDPLLNNPKNNHLKQQIETFTRKERGTIN
ncbi:MAG: ATP-dependent DNA helicase RecG [Clostridiales bacterium]|nr:ATP-dependent DNA helicase RecG [Clostridiales bacterium]